MKLQNQSGMGSYLVMLQKAIGFVALYCSFFFSLAIHSAETKPLKVLMVMGGCCHDYTNQVKILSEGLRARVNLEIVAVVEGSDREHRVSIYENKNWADGYDAVIHNECFGMVKDNSFIENIAAPHGKGLPGVMLHCSTHSYRAASTDAWRQCLGVSSFSHEARRDMTVTNIAKAHPIMKDFPVTWFNPQDELYKVEKLWPTATPLAEAYGIETKKTHTCVWINEYGKGKLFVTTMGHQNSTMEQPVYLDLVARGLLWACGKLDEDGRAKTGYGNDR